MRNSSPPVIPNIDSSHTMVCVVGMGANVGDRWTTLRAAVSAVARVGEPIGVSPVYETEPVGGPPQPRYLNAALGLKTRLGPLELLAELLRIERAAGRERRVRWGPRTLDLDMLWIHGLVVKTPTLEVPHPRLLRRPFALAPLLDVMPMALDPGTGESYAAALEALAKTDMSNLGPLLDSRATIA